MGNGSFDGKKFELFATFDFNAIAVDFSEWNNSFQAASQALYEATDGQMSIGKITVANNRSGVSAADMLLTKIVGDSSTTAPIKPNSLGSWMILRKDEKANAGVVVHEFGHYLFALEDEYRDTSGNSGIPGKCTDNAIGEHACIMEFSDRGVVINPSSGVLTSQGDVSEFCCAANHTKFNNQEKENGESCWETIVRRWGAGGIWGDFPEIKGPSSGNRPHGPVPGSGPDAMVWNVSPSRTRYLFVLSDIGMDQLSYSDFFSYFIGPLTFLEANIEFRFLIPPSQVANFKDAIQVSFPQWKRAREYSHGVFTLNFLNQSLDAPPASNQRLVFHGVPTAAMRNLIAEGANQFAARVSKVGFFAHTLSQSSDIQDLAFRTNGRNRILFKGNDARSRVHNVSQYLATLFDTLENWGMANSFTGVFPNAINKEGNGAKRYSADDLKRVKSQAPDSRLWADHFDFPVFIEHGAMQAAFLLCIPSDSKAWLYLQKPNGQIVDPKDVSVTYLTKSEYQLCVVSQLGDVPIAGKWFVRVERTAAPGPTPFKILAFAKNFDLQTFMRIIPDAQPDRFTLEVPIRYQWLPVCNMSPVVAELFEYTSSGEFVSSRLIELLQKGLLGSSVASRTGTAFRLPIQHSTQNNLAIRIVLNNVGSATLLDPEPAVRTMGNGNPFITSTVIPPFNRVLESFIGPKLPVGK